MANSLDATALVNIAKNRSRLLRLADGIRTRKKPGGSKKCMRLDPGYTNIEHLVFGTYRARASTPDSSSPTHNGFARHGQHRSSDGSESSRTSSEPIAANRCDRALSEPTNRCECSRHSPHLRQPPSGGVQAAAASAEGDGSPSQHQRREISSEPSGHVEDCIARSQSDSDHRSTMNEQKSRIRKTESSELSPRCISWRDVAASRASTDSKNKADDSKNKTDDFKNKAADEAQPRSKSVRLYSNADKSALERQNTFPSGIPKPVHSGRPAEGHHHRTRQHYSHGKSATGCSPDPESPGKQHFRKSSSVSEQRGRSPGLQQIRNHSAFRKTEDENVDANGKASSVTCKIRITPPNGPPKSAKGTNKNSPRNSFAGSRNSLNGSKTSLVKAGEEKQRQRAEEQSGSRTRSRSRGHPHGMQNAIQKGDRQVGRVSSGIPEPKEGSNFKNYSKKTEEPKNELVTTNGADADEPEGGKKTTWAQLRSRSTDTPVPIVSKHLSQLPPRRYHSLDDAAQDSASPSSFNIVFDCSRKSESASHSSKIRLDVSSTEPMSLPLDIHKTVLDPCDLASPSSKTHKPLSRLPCLPPPVDGPISLPLTCDDEESSIMSKTNLPQDFDEVQLRTRAPRALGSPSRQIDLRLLAAFQRYGEEHIAKEVLEPEGWMSDIEERDENSSSGASRAASEEPPELDRKSPRRPRAKGGSSLGLERLIETPYNVSVIAIENGVDSPERQATPRSHRQPPTVPEETCLESSPDGASVAIQMPDRFASAFVGREQTSVTRRAGMSASSPPAKSPSWEKSVTIETGALTNCHLLTQESPDHGVLPVPPTPEVATTGEGTPSRLPQVPGVDKRPAKPSVPAPLPPGTPIHASCRLLRNRPISRSERHLKTTSTPEIRAAADAGSTKDVRRPWSEVYCEVEARNLLAQSSSPNCHSVPNFPHFDASSHPTEGGHSFFHRLSSVRATDSMLQKFRKSFSLRFQRSGGRCVKPDPAWTPTGQATPAQPAGQAPAVQATAPSSVSTTSDTTINTTLASEVLDRSFATDSSVWNAADTTTDLSSAASGQQPSGVVKEEAGVFKLGLSALRSSRERKKGKSKKKEARGSKCNSADSGIQVEGTCASSDGTNEPNSAGESPAVVRRRATSQSQEGPLRKDARPISDYLADDTLASNHDHQEPDTERERSVEEVFQELDTFNADEKLFSPVRRTPSVERQLSTPPPIKVRTERNRPKIRRQKARARLRRSISQPLDLEKMGLSHKSIDHGLSDQEASREPSTASSEEDFSSDNEGGFHVTSTTLPKHTAIAFREMYEDTVTFAEALWDHVTIDPEELPFKAGEVIEVTDSSDKDWWWGAIGNRSGWFPAAFVRLRVSQEATVEDCILRMSEGNLGLRHCQHQSRKMSVSLLSNEQVRANVVREIVTTERDFVRHLKDVVEGYLSQVRRRPDMFSDEHISTIFGNVEEIYQFQSTFLKHLESSINWQLPHSSEIGHCFLLHKDRFRIYSEYCNNHPLAVSQLQELYADPKYIHFFEACRLLQEMIDISLDGFLLTPVQKICKYPLQLAELLKYTRPDHRDYQLVRDALGAMRGVAQLVNERKRRMECLERLVEWQKTIEGWEDGDLLDCSSMLINSGEVTRVTSSWSRDLSLFLFDHTIIYCKKDLLKRNVYVYRGRINLDHCCVFDVEDGKDAQFGITIRNAWKIHCNSRDKWFLFYAKSPIEKSRWLQAFREERQQVTEDRDQGFRITEQARKAAKLAVVNKSKVKRPRAKIPKGPRPHPDTAVVELLLDPSGPKTRSGSLPSNLNPAIVVNGNARAAPAKKKGSGWFHFGSGKKCKK